MLPMYDPSETITIVPFLMDVAVSRTFLEMCLSWKSFPSGSLYIRHSSVCFYLGCVSVDYPSDHTSPAPLLVAGVFLVICIPYLGGSTGTIYILYIFVWGFSICVTRSCWYQIPTTCIYRWPGCGWRN